MSGASSCGSSPGLPERRVRRYRPKRCSRICPLHQRTAGTGFCSGTYGATRLVDMELDRPAHPGGRAGAINPGGSFSGTCRGRTIAGCARAERFVMNADAAVRKFERGAPTRGSHAANSFWRRVSATSPCGNEA